jgi:hypothetical protein
VTSCEAGGTTTADAGAEEAGYELTEEAEFIAKRIR